MGYGMRPTLDFPTSVRWATETGITSEPNVSEPSEERKDTGADYGEQPPPKEWNWIVNSIYNHLQRQNASIVSNWFCGELISGAYILNWIVFHPDIGHWITAESDTLWLSGDGKNWGAPIAITGGNIRNGAGIDLTRYIYCDSSTAAQLKYSINGTSWSTETVTGLTGTSYALCTKYPDNNFTIVGSSQGKIRYSTTGIGGTWTAPTTAPITSEAIRTICRIGVTSFIIQDQTGATFVTNDDGDTWGATTIKPSDVVAFTPTGALHMAAKVDTINTPQRDSTLVVVGGDTGGSPGIAVSHDNGDTWESASLIEDSYTSFTRTPQCVYYCGADIWISTGTAIASGTYDVLNALVSYDNGDTWRRASYNTSHQCAVDSLISMNSDGKQIIAVGAYGLNVHSLAMPNSMNG